MDRTKKVSAIRKETKEGLGLGSELVETLQNCFI